jgi:hypothetical protein
MFVNPTSGNLHLKDTATAVIDKAPALASVVDDIDGNPRPSGAAYDIGADEFVAGQSSLAPPTNLRTISVSGTQ